MDSKTKVGVIICDRYRTCAGGKCLRAMHNREGAFSRYAGQDVELVGYTTCNGCPGGNIEYTGDEMVKNGAQVIHFGTCLLVGYPPCPRVETFKKYLETKYGVQVIVGTHPVPQKYYDMHQKMGDWQGAGWEARLENAITDEEMRKSYN